MPRETLFPAYIKVLMTYKDKEILDRESKLRSTTAAELIRGFIRSLDSSVKE